MKPFHTASIFFLLAGLLLAGFTHVNAPVSTVDVATWTIDKSHSRIGFTVRHLGISKVSGNFKDYDATIKLDPSDLSTLEATATVQIASIDTDNERRDSHLKSDDFFNAEKYPTLEFVSKEVRNIDGNSFELVGDLTMRDVTQEVVLEGKLLGTTIVRERVVAAFEAETTINRFDYGLKWNRALETGGLVVGEDVTINLELEVVQQ